MKTGLIKVGKRLRQDLGDLETLKESIQELGQLQPIIIDEDNNLIAGLRRLEACKQLGIDVDVNVIKLDNVFKGEIDENVVRKDFTHSEDVAIWNSIEKRKNQYDASSESDGADSIEPRQRAAKLLGISTDTLSKAKQVVGSGDKKLIEKMDKTGNVEAAYKVIRHEALLKKVPPLPTDKYRIIYADPPWKYGNSGLDNYGHAEAHFPTMSIKDLCDMPIKDLAEKDSVLFLWTTSPLLEDSFKVINAWGFKYKSSFVWDKLAHNFAHYNSVRHELLLIATKGSCLPDIKKLYNSVVSIKRTVHSEKPEYFRQMIDSLYIHGRRIELFARKKVIGWDSYGNQLEEKKNV